MQDKLLRRLSAAGITDCEPVKLQFADRIVPAVVVHHDYDGIYPTFDALNVHRAVLKIADKLGLKAEARGCYTATMIYLEA